jgi:hypothetical protein
VWGHEGAHRASSEGTPQAKNLFRKKPQGRAIACFPALDSKGFAEQKLIQVVDLRDFLADS